MLKSALISSILNRSPKGEVKKDSRLKPGNAQEKEMPFHTVFDNKCNSNDVNNGSTDNQGKVKLLLSE